VVRTTTGIERLVAFPFDVAKLIPTPHCGRLLRTALLWLPNLVLTVAVFTVIGRLLLLPATATVQVNRLPTAAGSCPADRLVHGDLVVISQDVPHAVFSDAPSSTLSGGGGAGTLPTWTERWSCGGRDK